MPKKKAGMSPEEQSAAFERETQRRIDAGELSPDDAERALDWLVRRGIKEHDA